MKIYTKSGDDGTTALIGGKRVQKADLRIEAYGTVDELIAYIGLIRDKVIIKDISDFLVNIQDRLMTCASILATDCDDCKVKIPTLTLNDIQELEKEIDKMDEKLPDLNSFVLPGGHALASHCHIARTICRRAERRISEISIKGFVPELVIAYINRLSDYLFTLSRLLLFEYQADEIKWKPRFD